MNQNATQPVIVGIGEALVDIFPEGEFIGGAPMNVAVHAQQLGNAGVAVSRVGKDERGNRILAELVEYGLDPAAVQVDRKLPTGTVMVRLDEQGQPQYEIVVGVAWDALLYDDNLHALAQKTSAVCFGTLAQRDQRTRGAILQFLENAQGAIHLFDVNLRQDAYSREIIAASLEHANAAKFNDEEIHELADLLDLTGEEERQISTLIDRFDLRWVALTRGADGTVVYDAHGKHDSDAVALSSSDGDAVGAGDATASALLHGAIRNWPWSKTLVLANRLGAHVASQSGACPAMTDDIRILADAVN